MELKRTRTKVPRVSPGKVEVNRIRDGGIVFRQVLVPCGKKNCTKCPHGPYWYLAFWKEGRWREKYIGKTLSDPRAQRDGAVRDMLGRVLEKVGALDEGRKAINEDS